MIHTDDDVKTHIPEFPYTLMHLDPFGQGDCKSHVIMTFSEYASLNIRDGIKEKAEINESFIPIYLSNILKCIAICLD